MSKKSKKRKPLADQQSLGKEGEPFFSPTKGTPGLFSDKDDAAESLFGSNIPKPFVHRSDFGVSVIVYFGKDSAFLNSQNHAAVQEVSKELSFLKPMNVSVNGHASSEGSQATNKSLSENRRNLIISLLSAGDPREPIKFEGGAHGETKLVVPETGKTDDAKEENRRWNRRVEITILYDPKTVELKKEQRKEAVNPKIDLFKLPPKVWAKMLEEERNRRLFEIPTIPPPETKSLNDLIWEKFDARVDHVLRKLDVTDKWRERIKGAAKSAVKKGVSTLIDEALDQTDLDPQAKKAIKKGIEAAGEIEISVP